MWPREGSAGRSVLLRQHPRGPRQRRAVASMGQGPEVTSRQMRRPCSMAVLSLFARGAPPPGLFGCRSGAVGLAGTLTWVRPESKEGSLTEVKQALSSQMCTPHAIGSMAFAHLADVGTRLIYTTDLDSSAVLTKGRPNESDLCKHTRTEFDPCEMQTQQQHQTNP